MAAILAHCDASATREISRTVIIPLYEATHVGQLSNPFYSAIRFVERLQGYITATGFALVLARSEMGEPIGLGFGYPLPSGTRWWQGLASEVPEGFTDEDGTRTFALNELMVHPDHQRQGVARTLHDTLMRSRPEQRATLLVRGDNAAARTAYSRWGWSVAAKLKPFADSPIYDALILDLPLS